MRPMSCVYESPRSRAAIANSLWFSRYGFGLISSTNGSLVFDEAPVPKAVMPACGILQVSNPERFGITNPYLMDRLHEVAEDYLHGVRVEAERGLDLADPVVALERGEKPHRPLPPFFAPVGTWDVLIDDTRRLAGALERLGVPCDARYYPRGFHAFHGFVFTPSARQCWRDAFGFLADALGR